MAYEEQFERFYELLGETEYEPGVYHGISDKEYFSVKAVNNSLLSELIGKTPAHMFYKLKHQPDKQTSAMALGTAAHERLLRPNKFDDKIKTIPDDHKSSKRFHSKIMKQFPEVEQQYNPKDKWADNFTRLKEAYPDVTLTDQDKKDQAEMMIRLLKMRDVMVNSILASGKPEVMIVWKDPETGLLCKGKLDWVNFDKGIFFDYKTSGKELDLESGFKYKIADYGYHRQFMFYDTGAEANDLNIRSGGILAQETFEPYLHAWFELEGRELEIARQEIRHGLQVLAGCIRQWNFYGYQPPKGRGTFQIQLPYRSYHQDILELEDEDDDIPTMNSLQDKRDNNDSIYPMPEVDESESKQKEG